MLVILGYAMVLTFMVLIMTKRMSPMLALIIVPTVFGLFAGAGLGLGDMVTEAIGTLAPTAALLMFAIMYFGLMIDVGLFDPLVRFILRVTGNDPAKIVLGTALLAGAVSLDGDGSTTFIVVTAAMLPIYLKLGMSPVVMTCVAGLTNGTLNIVPWGGPTARAAAALKIDPTDIFVPLVPSLVVGLLLCFTFAWTMGLRERKRLGLIEFTEAPGPVHGCSRRWAGPAAGCSRAPRSRSDCAAGRPTVGVRTAMAWTARVRGTTAARGPAPWPRRCSTRTVRPCGRSASGSTWR
jgi:CitMHS family citrate-Mg2+:H+ or citrate-Ca2+:H+ symporter